MITAYLKFLYQSKNEHAIHSPFVYELYTKIIKNYKKEKCFEEIENYRKSQLINQKVIEIQDFGAGSKYQKGKTRKIAEIAKNAEKPAKFGQLLYRLIQYLGPNTIFDLGTSLGITTLYQAMAMKPVGKLYTFEGCQQTLNEAKNLFEIAKIHNIDTTLGNIDETLPQNLAKINSLDFAFFDANHRYEPTIIYFETCLSKAHENSVFVFDDIHWSPEMEKAWEYIKAHPKVMISIDLFFVGIIFFRNNQPKQHYILRF